MNFTKNLFAGFENARLHISSPLLQFQHSIHMSQFRHLSAQCTDFILSLLMFPPEALKFVIVDLNSDVDAKRSFFTNPREELFILVFQI
jgi:hypothetical protein